MKERDNFEKYFMNMALQISTRSTCLRRHIGAVIVRGNKVLSTGYNGAPKGIAHCLETGCIRDKKRIPSGENHEICRAVHAEQNAIINANGSLEESVMFVTTKPCFICAKMIINAGIKSVYFLTGYPDKLTDGIFKEANIKLIKVIY